MLTCRQRVAGDTVWCLCVWCVYVCVCMCVCTCLRAGRRACEMIRGQKRSGRMCVWTNDWKLWNYRTLWDFFHYWSYIVQRSKLSYKYDNYRTSGNTDPIPDWSWSSRSAAHAAHVTRHSSPALITYSRLITHSVLCNTVHLSSCPPFIYELSISLHSYSKFVIERIIINTTYF